MISNATAQKAADLIIRSAVDIANGKSKQDVIARLTGEDYSPETATEIATRAEELKRAERRRCGITTVQMGAVLCGIGLLITIGTYVVTADIGRPHLFVTVGLIVGGICFMIKGFWRIAFR